MKVYPSDISDSQWEEVSKYLKTERSRKVDIRSVFNGILYLVKTGCQWRFLPKEYPNHNTVFYYFNSWKHSGVFERMQLDIAGLIRKKKENRRSLPLE
jgi:transposase